MRALLLNLAFLCAAGAAQASSIDNVTNGAQGGTSVEQVRCAHCPPRVAKTKTDYIVPEIAPGTDRIEVKEIGGEMKLVRTEAWLGGSPVVFVSKASEQAIEEARARNAPETDAVAAAASGLPAGATAQATLAPTIDNAAKTGALSTASMASMAAISPAPARSREIDLKKYQLRLE